MNYKYMRIQGRDNSYITKYPKGVFSLCWNLIRDEQLTDEEKELFFKPYDVVYTNFVGTIVYEDDWQVAVQVENGKMI